MDTICGKRSYIEGTGEGSNDMNVASLCIRCNSDSNGSGLQCETLNIKKDQQIDRSYAIYKHVPEIPELHQ